MKKMTLKKLVNVMQTDTEFKIDFRKYAYLPNPYGLGPVSDYGLIEHLVKEVNSILGSNISIDRLYTESIKSVLEDEICEFNNQ